MATEQSILMSRVYFEPSALNQTRIGFKKTNHLKKKNIETHYTGEQPATYIGQGLTQK